MRMTISYHRILFEEEKLFILLALPFCEQNEVNSKDFIKKFHKQSYQ